MKIFKTFDYMDTAIQKGIDVKWVYFFFNFGKKGDDGTFTVGLSIIPRLDKGRHGYWLENIRSDEYSALHTHLFFFLLSFNGELAHQNEKFFVLPLCYYSQCGAFICYLSSFVTIQFNKLTENMWQRYTTYNAPEELLRYQVKLFGFLPIFVFPKSGREEKRRERGGGEKNVCFRSGGWPSRPRPTRVKLLWLASFFSITTSRS